MSIAKDIPATISIKSNFTELEVDDYILLGRSKWRYIGKGTRHNERDGIDTNCFEFRDDAVANSMVFTQDEVATFINQRLMRRLTPAVLTINDNLTTVRR